VRSWYSRRRVFAGIALVIVVLLLWRPGAERLRARLTQSLSLALGRPVTIGSVSLQFLPRPGFELSGFTVQDDPQFSAEPILRADQVTVWLHLSSLWRRRLEIARLRLTEPSLNLARSDDGRWNLEPLLEHTARTPAAPTGLARSEDRPRFPYIEASEGRINFKLGREKKSFALTNADFALWLESNNQWGMRLQARPVRTDMGLSDTGIVRVEGTWGREEQWRTTPVQMTLRAEDGQLGQLTRLLTGYDRGWRGGVQAALRANGTISDLALQADVSVDDFRRYDISTGRSLRLAATCAAHYASATRTLSAIACTAPVGAGRLDLSGSLQRLPEQLAYGLTLTAVDVPAQSLLELARRMKQQLPPDLSATGTFDAKFAWVRDAGGVSQWAGEGGAKDVTLRSSVLSTDLALGTVPLRMVSPGTKPKLRAPARSAGPTPFATPAENYVEAGPMSVALSKSSKTQVHVWLSRAGYGLQLTGAAPLEQLLRLGRAAGFATTQAAVKGDAEFDLRAAGLWSGFTPPRADGWIQLHSLRAEFPGVNAPLEASSARALLTPQTIALENVAATLGDLRFTGNLRRPRTCPAPCRVEADLHFDEISTDVLSHLLNPRLPRRAWYQLLNRSAAAAPALLQLDAQGAIQASRFSLRNFPATNVSAHFELEHGKLALHDLRAELLGGHHRGQWSADFTQNPPLYSGSGSVERTHLVQLGDWMREPWATGTAGLEYKLELSGFSAVELQKSARGNLTFDWQDGSMAGWRLKPDTPLRFRRFRGTLLVSGARFELSRSRLECPVATYTVTGTASFARKLDLKLDRGGAPAFTVSGPLTAPLIEPAAPAQAKLQR
jgi:hypothetical protein